MKEIVIQRLKLATPIIIIGIIIDQLSKLWAVSALKGGPRYSFLGDSVRIIYAENTGAFLGMGQSLPDTWRFWILTAFVGLFLLGLLAFTLFSKELDTPSLIAMTLIFTGGLGNFIDRAANNGAVVDFLNMGIGGLRTGIFNIADVYIMVGAGLVIIGPWLFKTAHSQ